MNTIDLGLFDSKYEAAHAYNIAKILIDLGKGHNTTKDELNTVPEAQLKKMKESGRLNAIFTQVFDALKGTPKGVDLDKLKKEKDWGKDEKDNSPDERDSYCEILK